MPVRVTCPNPSCRAVANVEEQSLGKRGRCKKCGHVFALARPDGEAASMVSGDASAWKKGSTPAKPTELPEQFGRYRIMKQLGQGGMGAVYLALDTKLDRQVALKVPYFHPSESPQAVQRFEREARAAATLDHPNLCPIHDVGEIDGIHYLTMPYIQGKTLADALSKDQTFTESQAAAVIRKLALALQEAHEKGIIHRDLKPGNIMINRRREMIIMDFGLARVVGGDEALTRTGNVLGTALYMAPEQAAGDVNAIGPACDVYSLGVILHELLTGRRPFEGPWSLVIGLKNVKDPDPPSQFRADLSPALEAICLKALARDPNDRFRSMAEFAGTLDAFLTSARVAGPVLAPSSPDDPTQNPESLAARAFASADESPGLPASTAPRDRSRRLPVRAWAVALGAVAAALLLILIPMIFKRPAQVADGNAGGDSSTRPSFNPGAFSISSGEWTVAGDELHQLSTVQGWSSIHFGDPDWVDYDFSADVMLISGENGCRLIVRRTNGANFISFNFSFDTNPPCGLYSRAEGTYYEWQRNDWFRLKEKRWYMANVSVRGGEVAGTLRDEGGEVLRLAGHTTKNLKGCVGFSSWGAVYRFKNIKVTAPDGEVLWNGPPAIGPAIGRRGAGINVDAR